MVSWLSLVPIGFGCLGLGLALLVAVRNRSLFGPRLQLQFRTPLHFRRKLTRFMKRDPAAIFILSRQRAHTEMHIPISLRNQSRRKIGDVKLVLSYPKAFFVSNRDLLKNLDRLLEHFPESEEELAGFRAQVSKRSVTSDNETVSVTYEVGTLRPGEGHDFSELIEARSRELCFTDDRFSECMFSNILVKLRDINNIRALCHIRATVYSDLNRPRHQWVNIVSAVGKLTEDLGDMPLSDYCKAHWLNQIPSGAYFGPRLPFPKSYRSRFSIKRPVDFIEPKIVTNSKRTETNYVASSFFDGLRSRYGIGYVTLPGFDYFVLPKEFSVDNALLQIGYGKMRAIQWRRKSGGANRS